MKHNFLLVLFVILYALSLGACRSLPMVQNITEEQFTYNGNPSLEQIGKEIVSAGISKGWLMKINKPGDITATLHSRAHMAKVSIQFDEKKFSITYLDSENLRYNEGKIHGTYNRWIRYLKVAIQSYVARL